METYFSDNALFETILSSSFDGLFITDGKGNILYINPVCEGLFGMTAEEARGKSAEYLEQIKTFYPSATTQAIAQKRRVTMLQQTQAGSHRLVTANPVLDKDGDVQFVVGNSRDISELMKLRHEIQEIRSQLKRVTAELGELRLAANIPIVSASQQMRELLAYVNRIAGLSSTVLIQGESGVGKDILARYIHNTSSRARGPFVKVNCGAIPEPLLESEIFGYEKGAFTGALQQGKPGKLELADGGTLQLDEIGDMPLALQSKLLQVTEESSFYRIGGTKTVQVDVRFIATTNRNLEDMVRQGRFRSDLYYRLNVIPIKIPALRNRRADIIPLALCFLSHFCVQHNLKRTLSDTVQRLLCEYDWPGNVRELRNLIEYLVVGCDQAEISESHLPDHVRRPKEMQASSPPAEKMSETWVSAGGQASMPRPGGLAYVPGRLDMARFEAGPGEMLGTPERNTIITMYAKYRSIRKIGEMLGVDPSTVSRKIAKYFGGVAELKRILAGESSQD